jgi:hypothetical protein
MNIRDLDDQVLKQIIRDALPFSGDLPFPDLPYDPPNRAVGRERRKQEINDIYNDLLSIVSEVNEELDCYEIDDDHPVLDYFIDEWGDINQKNKKLANMNAQNLLEMLLLNPQNDEKMILPNIEMRVPTKKEVLQKRLTASRNKSEEMSNQLNGGFPIDDDDERTAALQLYRDELYLQADLEDAIALEEASDNNVDDLSNQVQALNVEGSGFSFPSLL